MPYYNPCDELQVSQNFFKTSLPGLFYFQAPKFNDRRGFFSEVVKLPELEKVIGRPFPVKQVNYAHSAVNTVRGMHAEGWNKLVFVTSGLAFCTIADIRAESDTYKQTECFKLGYDQKTDLGQGLFISQGLANSAAVLAGPLHYIYLVDRLYSERSQEDEQAISIFDPELNIDWPISQNKMILSKRDQQAVKLSDLEK